MPEHAPPHAGGHDWRQAGQEIRCARCLRRFPDARAACRPQEERPPRHAGGRSPLCGAPYSADSDWGAADCPECVRLVREAPAPSGHDLRADPAIGILACARCFRARFDFTETPYCADAPALQYAHVARHAHAVRGDELQNLCRPGTEWARPVLGLHLGKHAAPVTCGDCRDAIASMPPAVPLHDLRLADGGAACAACFLLAPSAADLDRFACDGGAFVPAIPFFVPFAREHAADCRHYEVWRNPRTKPVRITCAPCMRRISKAPPIPA